MPPKIQLGAVSLVAALFAFLYFFNPRENRIEITKALPVQQPLSIDDQTAISFSKAVMASVYLNSEEVLKSVPSVAVQVSLNKAAEPILDVEQIKAKIELTLRKYGIPVKSDSVFVLTFLVSALPDAGGQHVYAYSVQMQMTELVYLLKRETKTVYRSVVVTWQLGDYGTVGEAKFKEAVTQDAVEKAERFANDWLAANPKQ